jgi:hypothetical protein
MANNDPRWVDVYLDRFNRAKEKAALYRSLFEAIYRMFMPNRNFYDSAQRTSGQIYNKDLYDGTGVLAVRTFVSQVHLALTPIGTQWLTVQAGTQVTDDEKDTVNRFAQKYTDTIFQYLNESNFDMAINEAYYELAIGTGAIVINEGPDENPLIFSAVSIPLYYPEEGPFGTIETVWREFNKFPFRNILRTWKKATINPQLAQQAERDPNLEVDLIEGSVWDDEKNNFHYCVINPATKDVLFEEYSKSSPWIVFRGFKRANEIYGRGPCDDALPTMQSLNKMSEYELRSAQINALPIWAAVNDGYINPYVISLEPNSIIVCNPNASPSNPPLFPISGHTDVKFGQLVVQDLRDQINRIFFTDPLGPIDDPTKTATEINIRNQYALEAKIPFFGRLIFELLDKLTDRIIFILQKKGLLQPINIDGKQFSVKYKSPLVQQQNTATANNIVKFAQTLQSLVGPQLSLLAFDLPDLITDLASKMDIPLEVIKSSLEIQKVIANLQKQQQDQIDAQNAAAAQKQLPTPPQGGLPGGQLQ